MQPIHQSKTDAILAASPHPTISSLNGKVRAVKPIRPLLYNKVFNCFFIGE